MYYVLLYNSNFCTKLSFSLKISQCQSATTTIKNTLNFDNINLVIYSWIPKRRRWRRLWRRRWRLEIRRRWRRLRRR